jgi:hypothetical protein
MLMSKFAVTVGRDVQPHGLHPLKIGDAGVHTEDKHVAVCGGDPQYGHGHAAMHVDKCVDPA